MRKNNYLLLTSIILTLLNASACASNDSIVVNGKTLRLDSEKCIVSVDDVTNMKLNLPPKCFFIKESNADKIAHEYFSDIKSNVIIVVGKSVYNYPDFPITKERKDCGNQLQAILLQDNGDIKLSKVISESITCASIGVDKKEFWIISH